MKWYFSPISYFPLKVLTNISPTRVEINHLEKQDQEEEIIRRKSRIIDVTREGKPGSGGNVGSSRRLSADWSTRRVCGVGKNLALMFLNVTTSILLSKLLHE